jgi:redox-regulated HSP33 family molecular chaperone
MRSAAAFAASLDELGVNHQSRGMVKRVLFAALVGAALVCPASAEETKVSVQMTGIGSMSCAHWQSTQARRSEGIAWIYGFWTGLNYVAAASEQMQSKINTAVIVSEVEKTCARRPSQVLASAVWNTYLAIDKR